MQDRDKMKGGQMKGVSHGYHLPVLIKASFLSSHKPSMEG